MSVTNIGINSANIDIENFIVVFLKHKNKKITPQLPCVGRST